MLLLCRSVKLTGGPDGDVCGNMLRILYRDYGDNVRVVGLADGTASAEDPNGIPMNEVSRRRVACPALPSFILPPHPPPLSRPPHARSQRTPQLSPPSLEPGLPRCVPCAGS